MSAEIGAGPREAAGGRNEASDGARWYRTAIPIAETAYGGWLAAERGLMSELHDQEDLRAELHDRDDEAPEANEPG